MIIALGLLVDDSIIAIEMTVVKMEAGWDRTKCVQLQHRSGAELIGSRRRSAADIGRPCRCQFSVEW